MKAMILAAGLGTRLRPWTNSHPKALVPVGGVPMLERVIIRLKTCGVDKFVVNVHHFASQIVEFLESRDFGVEIKISDETSELLDTGGALVKARELLDFDSGPVIVHNVDILSNADIGALLSAHERMEADATLLVSPRESSRKLVFDEGMNLTGWHHLKERRFRPLDYKAGCGDLELAFSGIHIVDGRMVAEMEEIMDATNFSVMDYYLSPLRKCHAKGYNQEDLDLIDIGKPETLSQADCLDCL